MADFERAHKTIFVHEVGRPGGTGLVNNVNDPGGITKYGISLRFLKDNRIDLDGDGDIDADDILNCTPEQEKALYRQFFWNLVHGDNFVNQEVATKVFDMAVNMGPGRAVRIAQAAAGVDVDGGFGPKTFKALDVADAASLLASICEHQAQFYRDIVIARPRSVEFLEGWLVRAACTLSTPCRTCRAFLR
jgi:lysozyme family protein